MASFGVAGARIRCRNAEKVKAIQNKTATGKKDQKMSQSVGRMVNLGVAGDCAQSTRDAEAGQGEEVVAETLHGCALGVRAVSLSGRRGGARAVTFALTLIS
jgi:hypothetical protein